jgi:hypothetical protein
MRAQKTAFAEWRLMASKRRSKSQKKHTISFAKKKGAFLACFGSKVPTNLFIFWSFMFGSFLTKCFSQFDIILNNQASVLDSFFQIFSMAKPSIFQKNWQFQ